MDGLVLSIERCSLHDGPGLRTTVFLKGCPLTCLWCHNPESQAFKPELFYFDEKCTRCNLCSGACANHKIEAEHVISRDNCNACGKCVDTCPVSALEIKGVKMTAQDVMDVVAKDMMFYETSGGGLTISGGEPLSQFDFTLEILRLAKEKGIHTCIETSGCASTDKLLRVAPYVDLFLYDFKESDEEKHKEFTGVSRRTIIDNLLTIDNAGAKTILRCPIIPTYNNRDQHFSQIAKTANLLQNIVEVNIMPYHPMGASKAMRIGQHYPIADIGFPKDDEIDDWLQKVSSETSVAVKKG